MKKIYDHGIIIGTQFMLSLEKVFGPTALPEHQNWLAYCSGPFGLTADNGGRVQGNGCQVR